MRVVAIFGMAACLALSFAGAAWAAAPARPTNSECAQCHVSGGSASPQVDFSAAPVVYGTACGKCHWEAAGSHPFHNATWSCASCHPLWGATDFSAVPKTHVSGLGDFNTAASAAVDPATLHAIHSRITWVSTASKNGRECGSCHAPANCTACHGGGVDPNTHSLHTYNQATGSFWPGYGPSGARFGAGTTPANEYENSVTTALSCSNTTCHDFSALSIAPVITDDSNVTKITYTPSANWIRSSTLGYISNTYRVSNTKNATAVFTFTGQKVEFIADQANNRGMAKITLDGGVPVTVDLFNDSTTVVKQYVAFSSGVLAAGSHTLTVEVLYQRNAASRGYYVGVDAFRVYPRMEIPRARCAGCHATVHAARHAIIATPCAGAGCHNEPDLTAVHTAAGCACHSSADPKVVAAMAARTKDCAACHNPMATHGAVHNASTTYSDGILNSAVGGVVVLRCTGCHRVNLLADHGTDYTNCPICHAPGGPRSRITTWDKNCRGPVCHTGLNPATGTVHPAPTRAMDHTLVALGEVPTGYCQSCHGNPEGWQCGAPFGCHAAKTPPFTSVDYKPPTTTASRSGDDPIVWRLSATDIGDGLAATYYSFDGTPFSLYTSANVVSGVTNPADASAPYAHTLRYYSTDVAGNVEATQTSNYNVTDITPPIITFNGVSLGNDTYAAKSLVMSVVDPKVRGLNTGVAFVHTEVLVYYRIYTYPYPTPFYASLVDFSYPLDGTWDSTRTVSGVEGYAIAKSSSTWPTWKDYGPGSGRFQMQYYARDYTGNQTPTRYANILIDNMPPVTTPSSAGTYRWRLTTSNESGGAGVESTYYSFDGGVFTPYTAADATNGVANTQPGGTASGAHALRYYSVDKLGNTEVTLTLNYIIP